MLSAGILRGPHPAKLDEMTAGSSEPLQTEASESVGTENQVQGGNDDEKTLSEERVENAFQSAVDDLYKAMLKLSSKTQFPEVITLKNFQNVDDITAIVEHLDTEIEKFIRAQDLKVSSSCKEIWKTCVKNWFLTALTLIKPVVNIALVRYL